VNVWNCESYVSHLESTQYNDQKQIIDYKNKIWKIKSETFQMIRKRKELWG
jgi:hypothetical protein